MGRQTAGALFSGLVKDATVAIDGIGRVKSVEFSTDTRQGADVTLSLSGAVEANEIHWLGRAKPNAPRDAKFTVNSTGANTISKLDLAEGDLKALTIEVDGRFEAALDQEDNSKVKWSDTSLYVKAAQGATTAEVVLKEASFHTIKVGNNITFQMEVPVGLKETVEVIKTGDGKVSVSGAAYGGSIYYGVLKATGGNDGDELTGFWKGEIP